MHAKNNLPGIAKIFYGLIFSALEKYLVILENVLSKIQSFFPFFSLEIFFKDSELILY